MLVGESRRVELWGTPVEQDDRVRLPEAGLSAPDTARALALIGEVRRLWVLAAAAKISLERGPEALALEAVAERSGIAPAEVLALFPERDALLRATQSKAAAVAAEYAIPRFAAEPDPLERTRLAVAHLLAFCTAEPELAWACVVDCAATRGSRSHLASTLSRVVNEWFDGFRRSSEREQLVAHSLTDAMDAVAQALKNGDTGRMAELYPTTVEAMLTPFLGPAAARIVAARPTPSATPPRSPVGPHGERLVLDLRLTAALLDELKTFRRSKAWDSPYGDPASTECRVVVSDFEGRQ